MISQPDVAASHASTASCASRMPRAANAACTCTTYQSAKQFVQFNDVIFKGKAVSSKSKRGW